MKNVFILLIQIAFFLHVVQCYPQVNNKWIRTWDSQLWDEAHSITTDDSCNIYVAGWNYEWKVNYDFIFAKYTPDGDVKWSKIRNYSSGDQASHILYDGHGNIYISGYVYGDYSRTGGKMCLMKYTVNGDSLWEYVEYNNSLAQVTKIAIDDSCNIILAGFDGSVSSDFVTMKIDSAGNQRWLKTYSNNGPNDADKINDMCLDKEGNIYVTGFSDDALNFYNDIMTIKYNQKGDTVWTRRFNGPANYNDTGIKILVDKQKNVFVAGVVNSNTPLNTNYVLLKYDSLGTLQWTKYYDYQPAKTSFDNLKDMVMDKAGNIYLTGNSSSDNSQATIRIATVKFNQNGDTIWTARWGASGDKQPQQMVIDSMANIYITGYYYDNGGTGYNAITLKYDSAGILKWEAYYNDNTNEQEMFYALTLDARNDLIVTGRTHSESDFDFVTIKYQNSITGIPMIEAGNPDLHINCYPNPVSTSTLVNYYLPTNSRVTLKLFDIPGNELNVISSGYQESGNHTMPFSRNELMAGIYFLELTSEYKNCSQKIIITK